MERAFPSRAVTHGKTCIERLWLLLIGLMMATVSCQAGVIWGYVQDRSGNPLNGARMEYFQQECGCFPGQCGSGAPIIDYTGPSPYGHLDGQFYTINIPPGRYNVKVTYNGVGYDNALTNISIVTCDNRNVQGPFTLALPIGGGGPNYRFGLNPNNLTDPNRVIAVANHFQNLNVGWVRLEIIRSQPPSHWSWVVDQFINRGIGVIGLLSNQTWSGGSRDPSACAGGDRRYPTAFGNQLVRDFLNSADPYVQALKDRVSNWELWNEATAPPTHLCPENYAYLLVETRRSWPDIGSIGPSFDSQGIGTAARNYLDDLVNRTDKALYWQETYGDVPWDFVLHHPYPGGYEPENYIPQQLQMMFELQPKPVWFTEIGWGGGGDEARQADRLRRAYNVALTNGADVMFWFALYDCVPTFGLIADCGNPNGRQRPSYNTYRQTADSLR